MSVKEGLKTNSGDRGYVKKSALVRFKFNWHLLTYLELLALLNDGWMKCGWKCSCILQPTYLCCGSILPEHTDYCLIVVTNLGVSHIYITTVWATVISRMAFAPGATCPWITNPRPSMPLTTNILQALGRTNISHTRQQ